MIRDKETNRVIHYVERPEEDYINNTVNAGAYVFKPSIITYIQEIVAKRPSNSIKKVHIYLENSEFDRYRISLETDVLAQMAGTDNLYMYFHAGIWRQVKTPRAALEASGIYLDYQSAELATRPEDVNCTLIGNCNISPDAHIDPSAKVHNILFIFRLVQM